MYINLSLAPLPYYKEEVALPGGQRMIEKIGNSLGAEEPLIVYNLCVLRNWFISFLVAIRMQHSSRGKPRGRRTLWLWVLSPTHFGVAPDVEPSENEAALGSRAHCARIR